MKHTITGVTSIGDWDTIEEFFATAKAALDAVLRDKNLRATDVVPGKYHEHGTIMVPPVLGAMVMADETTAEELDDLGIYTYIVDKDGDPDDQPLGIETDHGDFVLAVLDTLPRTKIGFSLRHDSFVYAKEPEERNK